ncbi:MAG TPA: DUF4917 family protein [Candidatus Wunengus sp. YC63]|uniref:DUF4917 family protein n=1 Tax=unclassified Candidatus Wunengus TaxID=3367695 RepID=UPI00402A0B80
MTETELNNISIRQWNLISPRYKNPDLFLGNGFSINLSDKFLYSSLFDTFIAKTTESFKTLFQHFDTTNFELILSYLTHSLKVNTILGLPTDLVNQAIEALKNGLIEAIKEIHPRVEDIDWDKLDAFTNELKNYGNIYTTNYDLFLYHIIMKSIDESRNDKSYIAYQDYFWGDAAPGYKQFMPHQEYKYKDIYYLHGALFIFNHGIRDLKIKRGGGGIELIEIIAAEIQNGHFPLFITEGTAQDKMNSIYRSNYLYFCLQNFSKASTPLLIYGNSLSDFDAHIVKALNDQPRELVIALYTKGKSQHQLQYAKYDILNKFPKYKPNIEFVDSASVFAI